MASSSADRRGQGSDVQSSGISPEIQQLLEKAEALGSYSPGANNRSVVHPIPHYRAAEFYIGLAEGKNSDWVNPEHCSWTDRVQITFGKRAVGKSCVVANNGDVSTHPTVIQEIFRDFLAVRPLSRAWDLYMMRSKHVLVDGEIIPEEYANRRSIAGAEEVNRVVNYPRPSLQEIEQHRGMSSQGGALCAADLLDWSRMTILETEYGPFYRVPYIPNSGIDKALRTVVQSSDQGKLVLFDLGRHESGIQVADVHNLRRAVHGTHIPALHSILYHGTIKASSDREAGDRYLQKHFW